MKKEAFNTSMDVLQKDKEVQKLNQEILNITAKIREEHPELYALLKETPVNLSKSDKPITATDLANYLKTLQTQLETFENH